MENVKKSDGFAEERLVVLPEQVQQELSRLNLVRELFITDIGFFPHAKDHYRERVQGCDSNILIYCSEGEGSVQLAEDKPVKLHPHTLMVIPAGIPHTYSADSRHPWSIYWFHFKGSQASEYIASFGLDAGVMNVPVSSFLKFNDLFEQCYRNLADKSYSRQHHLQASQIFRYLLSTVCMTAVRPLKEERREKYLEQAISYMSLHLEDTLSLQDVAMHCGLSKPHLIHLFKQTVGYPPIDYFLRMKMQKASQMLDLTDWSLKEIGAALGIQDPYYFSRLFKKIMGHSPTTYRKIQKG
jgi:AraC-like DNA-binding protein